MKDSKGHRRYFYKGSGIMATKWLKNTSKNINYYFEQILAIFGYRLEDYQ